MLRRSRCLIAVLAAVVAAFGGGLATSALGAAGPHHGKGKGGHAKPRRCHKHHKCGKKKKKPTGGKVTCKVEAVAHPGDGGTRRYQVTIFNCQRNIGSLRVSLNHAVNGPPTVRVGHAPSSDPRWKCAAAGGGAFTCTGPAQSPLVTITFTGSAAQACDPLTGSVAVFGRTYAFKGTCAAV